RLRGTCPGNYPKTRLRGTWPGDCPQDTSPTDMPWGLSPRHVSEGHALGCRRDRRRRVRGRGRACPRWTGPRDCPLDRPQAAMSPGTGALRRAEVAPLRLGRELAQELVEPGGEGVAVVHDLVLLALHHLSLPREELVVREGLDQSRHALDHPKRPVD